jgi:hypothetical protein
MYSSSAPTWKIKIEGKNKAMNDSIRHQYLFVDFFIAFFFPSIFIFHVGADDEYMYDSDDYMYDDDSQPDSYS